MRDTTRRTQITSTGMLTVRIHDSPPSSRIAITMPPIAVIGCGDEQRACHQHEHLHLLDVVGDPW